MDRMTIFAVATTFHQRARAEGYEPSLVRFDSGAESGWVVHIHERVEGERRILRGSIWVNLEGKVTAEAGVPARILRLVRQAA